jgi:hypothetical protein
MAVQFPSLGPLTNSPSVEGAKPFVTARVSGSTASTPAQEYPDGNTKDNDASPAVVA